LNDGGVPNVVGTENPPLDGLDTGRFQGTREDQVKQKKNKLEKNLQMMSVEHTREEAEALDKQLRQID